MKCLPLGGSRVGKGDRREEHCGITLFLHLDTDSLGDSICINSYYVLRISK